MASLGPVIPVGSCPGLPVASLTGRAICAPLVKLANCATPLVSVVTGWPEVV